MFRGCDLVFPEWRWLYEPQSIRKKSAGLGFLHRAGRYRPGGGTIFVPGLLEL